MKHLVTLALLPHSVVFAQSDGAIAFEVASVRANTSATLSGFRHVKGRAYLATNQALRRLIADAYGVPAVRVLGGPSWIGAASADARFVGGERFDIVATLPEGAAAQQVPIMLLRRLLAERFKLAAHTEMRETPVYRLMIARAGQLGPQRRSATLDCDAAEAAGKVIPPPASGQQLLCASEVGGASIGRGQRISTLATHLALFAERPVIDRTGLTADSISTSASRSSRRPQTHEAAGRATTTADSSWPFRNNSA
jgi:uncharacterized protein (TIGR03435 family)